jgi:hypothetical protein
VYWWEEGNAACDCNREDFFLQAQGVDTDDRESECGDGRFATHQPEQAMFKITVTAKGSHEVLAQFSAATQAECFAWAEKFWLGDQYNWSANFTGYEAGIGGAL